MKTPKIIKKIVEEVTQRLLRVTWQIYNERVDLEFRIGYDDYCKLALARLKGEEKE